MGREGRGVMLRSMMKSQRGRGGKAGGKEGKRGLGDGARKHLDNAYSEASAGNTSEAAQAFANMATTAGDRGLPKVAAFLACKAATLTLGAGDSAGAVEHARNGIALAEGVAESKRVGRFFGRFIVALRKVDGDTATTLSGEVRERFGLKTLPTPSEGSAPNRAQRRALPKKCGICGTPVDGKSIRFEDDGTADCPRCGGDLH